ncbi:hypothetical protein LZF95_22505 [Algoriphagus sp. AGSA1]|uniref:hypothetical protein n=1 Tax=Algoriphagus sp. AGSA1 TaxID=2907213 RepID=UPI001F34744D|nr:hypothetical protein [Algoriphagus sp. AGSA1]MCE7057470.1 hypothetical protein [Algoriphagus sp. AGSA1]
MNRLLIFLVALLLGCTRQAKEFEDYSEKIGFDPSKPTLLISLENCSYCFTEYQETVKEIDKQLFNLVIISSQIKKASLLASPDNESVFVDSEKYAIKKGLIKSLPVILLPDGEKIEIFSPAQLLEYTNNYVL